ncbi:hypothetical protein [Clostridium saccharoperbutylacetonicum]|uniref:hypothetical protein n=1 Tax=Clostridium saccharoperbutylacetonicum TaxID=36745 RepID=UPI0039EA0C72
MKIERFLVFFLIYIFLFVKMPQAQPIPISTTYTQGIHSITQYSGKYITAKLITPDKTLSIAVIDSKGNQKIFLRFLNLNETVKLGPVQEGDILIIIGAGEVSFYPF